MNVSAGTAILGGTQTGYARSTAGPEDLAARVRTLRSAGCAVVYADGPGPGQEGAPGRERLLECLESLRTGDTLVVGSLDQLARSTRELTGIVGQVRGRGAGLRSLREGIDSTLPGGDAVFRVFDGLAGFGREAISAGTRMGLAAAQAGGKRLGRPPALTAERLAEVRGLLARPENSVSSVARQLGVSRSTIYKHVPEAAQAGAARLARAHLSRYPARPGRRALVIDELAALRGPVAGRVRLPLRLFWSLPDHQFDLDDRDSRLWYYQTILREASRAEDLTAYLDGGTLASIWPELYLPKGVRQAWEEHHPSLRAKVSPDATP